MFSLTLTGSSVLNWWVSCAMRNCAALTAMPLSLMRIGLRFMPESSFRRTSITTQACNIPSQEMIFSDVFLMLCQIGGDVPCSKEEISKRNKHVRQLDAIKDAEIIGKTPMQVGY